MKISIKHTNDIVVIVYNTEHGNLYEVTQTENFDTIIIDKYDIDDTKEIVIDCYNCAKDKYYINKKFYRVFHDCLFAIDFNALKCRYDIRFDEISENLKINFLVSKTAYKNSLGGNNTNTVLSVEKSRKIKINSIEEIKLLRKNQRILTVLFYMLHYFIFIGVFMCDTIYTVNNLGVGLYMSMFCVYTIDVPALTAFVLFFIIALVRLKKDIKK